MERYVHIFTTIGSKKEAASIAKSLVAKKFAACVQILGPITSIYRWKGKVETAKEWMCIIKSQRKLFDKIEAEIIQIHSYELPEITMSDISGNKEYLLWIRDNTGV